MTDYLDPKNYGPGKSGKQITKIRERLNAHGVPSDTWNDNDQANVRAFQLMQKWSGKDADGLPGPETLRRLFNCPGEKPKPPPARVPSPGDLIDLLNQKITLPSGLEVLQPELTGFSHPEWFYADALKGGVVFNVPVSGGSTTPKTKYQRSELREMELGGKARAEWSNRSGSHRMQLSGAFTALPEGKPEAVIGQIHDDADDVAMIRLEDDHLFVESRGKDVGLLDSGYRLGERFDISILANKFGVFVGYVNRTFGIERHVDLSGLLFDDAYFKAGCYAQAYGGQEHNKKIVPMDAFAETIIYGLSVHHS